MKLPAKEKRGYSLEYNHRVGVAIFKMGRWSKKLGWACAKGPCDHIDTTAGEYHCLTHKPLPAPRLFPALFFLLYLQRMSENSVFPSLLITALVHLSYSKTQDCFLYSDSSPYLQLPAGNWYLDVFMQLQTHCVLKQALGFLPNNSPYL